MLKLRGIKHNVLNAKQHALEAQIVAEAGHSGQVTIATNMAGRGTDIKLSAEVKERGGLAIIGTERHESRRVDRQLRGRAGRQGDPGSSQFFVSLEDKLMRLFGSDRIASMMDKMGLKEGEVIQAGMMSKAIERAQKKVEENHFGVRKRLLEYDDVMNSQREVIYTRRRHALYGESLDIDMNNLRYDYAEKFVEQNEGSNYEDFKFELMREVALNFTVSEAEYNSMKPKQLVEAIVNDLTAYYERKSKMVADTVRPTMEKIYKEREDHMDMRIAFPITDGRLRFTVPVELQKCKDTDGMEIYRVFAKVALFTTIDDAWREHLREMDDLRQSVQNATYEQKDPLLIYKLESFELFSKMLENINRDVLALINKSGIAVREANSDNMQEAREQKAKIDVNKLQASRMAAAAAAGQGEKSTTAPIKVDKSVGRNDPCPCGSGKKYKHCHGKL
jgi:preprotein translocase subunit SecA